MGPRFQNSLQSNFDQTVKISKSVFISNFPDDCSNRDLWKVCSGYGTVVDVFIPNKRSNTWKRFAFVRFIKVLNFDRLIENLKTIWIGRFHISANPARFERPKAPFPQKQMSTPSGIASGLKQPIAQHKNRSNGTNFTDILKPALVLDDSCLVNRDLAKCVMGEFCQFSSFNNLQVLLFNEGFHISRIVYLGGLWVMIELNSSKSKSKFMEHVEIGSKWGELVDLEDGYKDLFARKWICVMASHTENILESFKLIVKGKVFWARANELFVWSPSFKEVPERELFSDDESIKANEDANNLNLGDAENDCEVVSNTYFGDNGEDQGVDQHQAEPSKVQEVSDDPFNIYGLLNKCNKEVRTSDSSSSIPYPLGFTPINDIPTGIQDNPVVSSAQSPSKSARRNSSPCQSNGLSLRVMEDTVPADVYTSPVGSKSKHGSHKGGSMLEVLDGMIKVGQTMGFSMDGCLKDMEIMIGEVLVTGDFNEVCFERERLGSVFNVRGANEFNSFISNAGLVEIQLEGFSFNWSHPSAAKMSKLDRFLVSKGFLSLFPHISALCLDKNLSDHRPILLHELVTDYGATPFRLYHSWFYFNGFDDMVRSTRNSFILEDYNGMSGRLIDIQDKLSNIDRTLDQGGASDEILLSRMELMKQMHDIKSIVAREQIQKAKIQWAVEGDENSNFFHGVVNRKRVQLSVKGVMIDGEWVDEPDRVKEEFRSHFANMFQDKGSSHCRLNFRFPSLLSADQISDLEKPMSYDEIHKAVWSCGENKSPGPDGFTFEFFRKFWDSIGPDMCVAVEWFFMHNSFAKGCNASFITLISKMQDPKIVSDFRPISLIGSLYKVVTKILAICLSSVISDLISVVQTTFLPNRQILDGPFIINELLSWCRHKKQQAMVFKVDFAKAYDSVWWDYLDDVLSSFGFGVKWRSWIKGSLTSDMASVLWSDSNLSSIIHMLQCFSLASGLKINLQKSNLLGVGVKDSLVNEATGSIGCSVMKAPFKYLGVMVGSSMSKISAWDEMVGMQTHFWEDLWLGETPFRELFPRLYALDNNKECSIAVKMQGEIDMSFRRQVRGGVESQQLEIIKD
nr:RNA-directed DNA polymerase, eukaryota [Tanacetum cinerariifolium]